MHSPNIRDRYEMANSGNAPPQQQRTKGLCQHLNCARPENEMQMAMGAFTICLASEHSILF